jgi:hypothetical protein
MKDAAAGKGNPFRAFKAVFWAFFGIRKGAASQSDLASLKPWQVIVAGVIGAAIFVTVIVTLVRVITVQN